VSIATDQDEDARAVPREARWCDILRLVLTRRQTEWIVTPRIRRYSLGALSRDEAIAIESKRTIEIDEFVPSRRAHAVRLRS
jgi:hypothetical protein